MFILINITSTTVFEQRYVNIFISIDINIFISIEINIFIYKLTKILF